MTAIITLLLVLSLSMVVTRLATAALSLTGMSRPMARLQAVSAFTGAGFTTNESENMVVHPVRRRILIWLMILGNAGIVTAVSSLILTFTGTQSAGDKVYRFTLLAVGVAGLFLAAQSKWLERWMYRWMRWALRRWTNVYAFDYAGLLHLTDDYGVREIEVEEGDWLADKSLEDLRLSDEGVFVLGIHKPDGEYVGVPRGESIIESGDQLVLYGHIEGLTELDERRRDYTGEVAHRQAVAKAAAERRQQQIEDEQLAAD